MQVTVLDVLRAAAPARRLSAWPIVLAISSAAAGAALRVRDAWLPIPELLRLIVSDDAFYYFVVARNVTRGAGVTFDGERVTNGFHPLWLAVLTPVSSLVTDRELFVHVALTMSALLGAATSLLVFAIVARLTENRWAALIAAALYAFHPYLIRESINGLETQLAICLFAATILLFVRLQLSPAMERSGAQYLALGTATGLTFLARTDMAITMAPMLIWSALGARGHLRRAVWCPVAAAVVVAPWAAWMVATFGTLVQVSGVAVPEFTRQVFLEANGDAMSTQVIRSLAFAARAIFVLVPDLYLAPSPWLRIPAVAAVVVAVIMLYRTRSNERLRVRGALALAAMPAAGAAATLLFHTAFRWHVREWYFAPVALILTVGLGLAVNAAECVARKRGGPRVMLTYVAVAVVLMALYGPWQAAAFEQALPHKVNMFESARWVAMNVPTGASIGAFNSGILGYFSERTTVNLDGVVNEGAYRARMGDRMLEYVCSDARVDYLVDLNVARQWNHRSCPGDPCRAFEHVTTIGTRVPYFGGGRLDVLVLRPQAPACVPAATR